MFAFTIGRGIQTVDFLNMRGRPLIICGGRGAQKNRTEACRKRTEGVWEKNRSQKSAPRPPDDYWSTPKARLLSSSDNVYLMLQKFETQT